MRKILFRGKTKNGGQWVFGSFCPPCNIVWESFEPDVDDNVINDEEILPETLGQYIGMDDKNGNPIFEGDIVNIPTFAWLKSNCEVVFEDLIFKAKNRDGWFNITSRPDCTEVVGNVHDDPELLK